MTNKEKLIILKLHKKIKKLEKTVDEHTEAIKWLKRPLKGESK